jgi:hypothetical protein
VEVNRATGDDSQGYITESSFDNMFDTAGLPSIRATKISLSSVAINGLHQYGREAVEVFLSISGIGTVLLDAHGV